MAKRAARPKGRGAAGSRSRTAPDARKNVLSVRGTIAWRDWIMGLAAHRRLSAADVVDQALVEHALRHGYEPKPPPR